MEKTRHKLIQEEIEFERVWSWQDELSRVINGESWRLVDNRDEYIKKRMALEGLK